MDFAYVSHDAVPKTLYHYTSLEALVAIVRSKRLRASNIRFLNDKSESLRLKEDVVAILQKRVVSVEDKELVKTVLDSINAYPRQSLFVASLSEKSDLLSQWRAYCPSGFGVSIGFSSICLNEQWIANPQGGKPFFLGAPFQKVRYYDTAHQVELGQTIEKLLDLERKSKANEHPNFGVMAAIAPMFKDVTLDEEAMREITEKTFNEILKVEGAGKDKFYPPGAAIAVWALLLSPFIKHAAFQEECEWRKVVTKDSRPMPSQQFRMGKSTLIPFVEIMLDVMRDEAQCIMRKEYFIDEVVVGPTPTPELTVEAISSLFHSEGHPEVIVRTSSVPFRDW